MGARAAAAAADTWPGARLPLLHSRSPHAPAACLKGHRPWRRRRWPGKQAGSVCAGPSTAACPDGARSASSSSSSSDGPYESSSSSSSHLKVLDVSTRPAQVRLSSSSSSSTLGRPSPPGVLPAFPEPALPAPWFPRGALSGRDRRADQVRRRTPGFGGETKETREGLPAAAFPPRLQHSFPAPQHPFS